MLFQLGSRSSTPKPSCNQHRELELFLGTDTVGECRIMKTCRYCGRENPDEGSRCLDCGTEFVPEPIDSRPSEPPDRTWIKTGFLWTGVVLTLLLFYLLSLGPVIRWTGKVTSSTTTSIPNGIVSQRVMTIPRWVGIVYAPTFLLRQSAGDVGNLYEHYLEWWEKPEPKE